jgi:hypothetical protein
VTARQVISPLPRSSDIEPGEYQPGTCNIGPAEIARRRKSGHIALVATLVVFMFLVLVQAPHLARLVLILTAGGSASGYLQAQFHFCAGFGSRGVYNFGELGTVHVIASPEDRARDRARATQIGLGSLAIGIAVALVAVLLPF